MGIGYTIDTPIKVAHLGIASAISLVDDILVERMREFYSTKHDLPFSAINNKIEDFRAKRITAYLDTVNIIVNQKYQDFKLALTEKRNELNRFLSLLPDTSELKLKLNQIIESASTVQVKEIIDKYLHPGSIDVNIMTKLDKENYRDGEKLPSEFNDAHAALRGFANSTLKSSVVLSAGMNARLYTYLEQFEDFYPNAEGGFNKKIILKVSDYRSAIVQGKIFAKKGLWISEFRVESGLNCGGHAFATQGYLMGPILEEFSNNREMLVHELFDLYSKALTAKNKHVPKSAPAIRLTAQGGVGTAEEHNFLMNKYKLDSVGWGSPFMLVPEAVSIDKATIDLLANGGEEDYFLSHVSPVGVRFNNIKGASADLEQQQRAKAGKPGAPCTKQFVLLNTEFTERPICTASSRYQKLKIEELNNKGLSGDAYNKAYQRIIDKSCICNGLDVATLKSHGMDTSKEGEGVSVCPGPNLAYFSREASLKEMIDHICGRANLITHPDRPNLFIKELSMYLDYIEEEMTGLTSPDAKQLKSWDEYLKNLQNGMNYYDSIFTLEQGFDDTTKARSIKKLNDCKQRHEQILNEVGTRKSVLETKNA